jgi:hypothetical protein
MAPPTKKQLNKGFYGFQSDDAEFLKVDNPDGNWTAGASGHGYNARWNDQDFDTRGTGAYTDSDPGLYNKLADEHQEYAHQRLSKLIDNQEDWGSDNKITGGGGPVSDNAPDNSPGWKGSGRKGPRFAPKTGPQTNMTGWKK